MNNQVQPIPKADPPFIPTACQRKALRLLREAREAARQEGRDVWQFAVEIAQFHAAGLSNTDLRRLLCRGYLEHAQERTTPGCRRTFRHLSTLVLPRRTCFVLTAKGQEAACDVAAEKGAVVIASVGEPTGGPRSFPPVPRWDHGSRQLWWQDHLIKEFHRPAVNQELVLAALQEEGWPNRIDDPLPPTPDIDPKVRLHDTIKALNRHRHHRIVCFRGDGSGGGIRWIVAGWE